MDRIKRINRHLIFQLLLFALLIVVDRITKSLALNNLKDQDPVSVIKNIVEFQYLENYGAAFGSLQNQQWLFYILTAAVLVVIFYVFFKNMKNLKKYSLKNNEAFTLKIFNEKIFLNYILMVLASGAVGNFIDRILHKFVIDFIYFKIIDFWIFNFADICVTVSAILLIIYFIFIHKDNDNFRIFGKAKNDE